MSEKLGFEELRRNYKEVLSKAFATNDIDLLDSFSKLNSSENDRKAAMDQAFREKLLELLEEDSDALESYVCLCIESSRRHMVTPTLPVVLLGDIFDVLTINKCEKMFTYVENRVNIWKEELFFGACKNNLLRMCNDLLRRLSRSQNTVFCGRILLFLAKFFPFSERSGLNIVSEFNLDNITEYGGDNSGTLKEALDEELAADNDKNKLTMDYNLYCKFWGLQDFFRNPNSCYNKVQWKTFVSHSGSVLSAFGSYKLEAVELQKSKLSRLQHINTDIEMQDQKKEQHYFAKFLTNQKLLELQLSDTNFRRCVLIQFLILFQYLTSTVKFKMESQELKAEQVEWVKKTTSLVYNLLAETPADGKKFAECIKHILKKEEHWNNWKNDGCPEFQRPKLPMQVDSSEEVRRTKKEKKQLGDIVKEYESQGKVFMGDNELTKLWNLCPDNLSACRAKERDFTPSLESYMSSALDTSGGRRRTAESAWGWRALRLLSRRSPHFFTYSNNPIGSLPDYLDEMVKCVTTESNTDSGSGEGGGNHIEKSIKTEVVGEEITEEQIEAELIKSEDTNDMEQIADSMHINEDNEKCSRSRVTMITPSQLDSMLEKLTDWKKLAAKLGFKPDEILYFESEHASDALRAKAMLQIWFDDDEDASVENLLYIMEGLGLLDACEVLRNSK